MSCTAAGESFPTLFTRLSYSEELTIFLVSDCQVNDWKNGNPPHKTICGKVTSDTPLPIPPAPLATTTSRSSIPPPVGGYRRSIALVHQISLLERNPTIDYFLIPPAPLPDVGTSMAQPTLRELFRLNHQQNQGALWALWALWAEGPSPVWLCTEPTDCPRFC
jgi:hypothetical protein